LREDIRRLRVRLGTRLSQTLHRLFFYVDSVCRCWCEMSIGLLCGGIVRCWVLLLVLVAMVQLGDLTSHICWPVVCNSAATLCCATIAGTMVPMHHELCLFCCCIFSMHSGFILNVLLLSSVLVCCVASSYSVILLALSVVHPACKLLLHSL